MTVHLLSDMIRFLGSYCLELVAIDRVMAFWVFLRGECFHVLMLPSFNLPSPVLYPHSPYPEYLLCDGKDGSCSSFSIRVRGMLRPLLSVGETVIFIYSRQLEMPQSRLAASSFWLSSRSIDVLTTPVWKKVGRKTV